MGQGKNYKVGDKLQYQHMEVVVIGYNASGRNYKVKMLNRWNKGSDYYLSREYVDGSFIPMEDTVITKVLSKYGKAKEI
jgi:hypothetical protein